MSNEKYVIKFGISDPYYIAERSGDPGRTYRLHSAKRFPSRDAAEKAARKVIAKYPQRYNSSTHFEIEEIDAD